MKRMIPVLTALALIVLTASMALAQAPELRGTWKGKTAMYVNGEFREGACAYVINQQKDALFAGYKLWFTRNNVLAREKFTGIFDHGEFIMSEGSDGYAIGYLTSKQHMIVKYVEHGSSAKAIMADLERIRFTRAFVEIDQDGDNTIMRTEIVNHYPLNAERIIEEADVNKDGKLTRKEWEAWKKKNGGE